MRRTLGIESSCDETAVALLGGDGVVERSLLASQAPEHATIGGVVPELAARRHLETLPGLVTAALEGSPPPELVAVTAGPGLVGSLLVGVRFAAAWAWARRLPLVAVDHLHGHLCSPFLSLDGAPARPWPEPTLGLVASGGHSAWYLTEGGMHRRLCRTRDDAAGESFDKVARVLGLGYPGGPVVDRLAERGDPAAVELPRPRIKDGSGDLSFSGLKSAAIRWAEEHALVGAGPDADGVVDLAASFRRAVVDVLLAPLDLLAERFRPAAVTASGGVAANSLLRERLGGWGAERGIEVVLADRRLTADNAAMIARAGQLDHARGADDDPRRLDAAATVHWQPPSARRAS